MIDRWLAHERAAESLYYSSSPFSKVDLHCTCNNDDEEPCAYCREVQKQIEEQEKGS